MPHHCESQSDHQKLHTDSSKKRYQCGQCDNSYSNNSNLKRHEAAIHTTHTSEKSYHCESQSDQLYCGAASKLNLPPSGEKPFQFTLGEKHKVVHTEDKTFKCNDCETSFPNIDLLYEHNVITHNAEKPFLCSYLKETSAEDIEQPINDISISSKNNSSLHMPHTGENPM